MSLSISNVVNKIPLDFINREISKYDLPVEIWSRILFYLSHRDLGSAHLVCRIWRDLTNHQSLFNLQHLKTRFPNLSHLDEEVWKKSVDFDEFGLKMDKLTTSKPEAFHRSFIKSLVKFASIKVEGDYSKSLLTMPEGLSLGNLCTIAARYGITLNIVPDVMHKYGNLKVPKTYQVAVTDSVLLGSRDLLPNEQEEKLDRNQVEMIRLLPVLTLMVLTFINSKSSRFGKDSHERLFHDAPLSTFTRCFEKINGKPVIVGNFSKTLEITVDTHSGYAARVGAAAMKKLE